MKRSSAKLWMLVSIALSPARVSALPPYCNITTSLAGQFFTPEGGAGLVSVTATPGCTWMASNDVSWLTITSGVTGVGNGTVSYRVAPNSGAADRSGSISFASPLPLLPSAPLFQVGQVAPTSSFLPKGGVAHLAAGGAWTTTLVLRSGSGGSAGSGRLNFYDDAGNPLPLLISFPQPFSGEYYCGFAGSIAGPLLAATLPCEIPANGNVVIQITGDAQQTQVGWAQLLTPGGSAGNVTGFAIFTDSINAQQQQQATVPIDIGNNQVHDLWFDNTGGFSTGIAVANLSMQPVDVPVTIYDDNGSANVPNVIRSVSLPPLGHMSFDLAGHFGQFLADHRGTIVFAPPSGAQISVLGLRFNPEFAFTAIPVLFN